MFWFASCRHEEKMEQLAGDGALLTLRQARANRWLRQKVLVSSGAEENCIYSEGATEEKWRRNA